MKKKKHLKQSKFRVASAAMMNRKIPRLSLRERERERDREREGGGGGGKGVRETMASAAPRSTNNDPVSFSETSEQRWQSGVTAGYYIKRH